MKLPTNVAAADPKKVKVIKEFVHDSPLIACRFDPTGQYVVATSQDNKVLRWDLESGEKVEYISHDSWVRGIEFSADGKWLITGGFDGQLAWWDLSSTSTEPARKLDAHEGWIRSCHSSPNGQLLVTGGNDNLAKIWNLGSGELLHTLSGHEKNVYSVAFHPTLNCVLTGDLAGVVNEWDWSNHQVTRSFDAKALHTYNGGQRVDFGGVRSLAISNDQTQLACGGLHNASNPLGSVHDPLIVLFDWESQEITKSLIAPGLKGGIWRCLYHTAGFLFAASGGSSGGYLLFWDMESEKDIHRLKLPHLARDMDLHLDGLRIATSHYDKKLRICSLAPQD